MLLTKISTTLNLKLFDVLYLLKAKGARLFFL